jgi:hypothetical protein
MMCHRRSRRREADLIVSGDRHLLDLGHHGKIATPGLKPSGSSFPDPALPVIV